MCVKCLLQKAVHAPCSLCWLHKWGGLKCRANEGNRACSYCRVQPTLCKAQMLHIAPGNARGSDVALIKVLRSVRTACIMRGNAPCGVKGINGLRAFGAWHFCAGAKMPNVSIAVYVPPGRCPGLWATFGLSARPNHLLGVCANSFICMHLWLRLGIVQVNLALRSPCTNVPRKCKAIGFFLKKSLFGAATVPLLLSACPLLVVNINEIFAILILKMKTTLYKTGGGKI